MVLAGEEHKSIHSAELVLRQLAQADAERGDLVVAVGGGVVGDLGGFCAAVYQRGMRHVQVPTTVVAQVDSAYGGKTGVDLPEGKNYVGAYHQPAAVLCDPATLDTLPEEEASAGYAEVVKSALIAGGSLWARAPGRSCGRPGRPGLRADEARRGGRGRAGRRAPPGPEPGAHRGPCHRGGDRIRALQARRGRGHRAAGGARASGRELLRREVAALLEARGLPPPSPRRRWMTCWTLVERDKKRSGGRVPFVLVEVPGEVSPGHEIAPGDLRAAVEEVHIG